MRIRRCIFVLIVLILVIGCYGKSQNTMIQNQVNKIKAKTIAVLPIERNDTDTRAARLLRSRLLEELYFKGYAKLSLDTIDRKLNINPDDLKMRAITPQELKEMLGADAGLYCKLKEDDKTKIFYEPIKMSLSCELRSSETGETIWKGQSESVRRNFGLTGKDLEKQKHDDFEEVIDEAVNKVIKTLPDGPNLSS